MDRAFLEDYHLIKVILYQYYEQTKISIEGIESNIKNASYDGTMWHLYLETKAILDPHFDYYVKVNDDLKLHVELGKITRSKMFNALNAYDGPLGITYHKTHTTFRLWSPVCKEVYLTFKETSLRIPLAYLGKGLWEVNVSGDLENKNYRYLFRINDNFISVLDPYGISMDAKHEYNQIVDLTKTYKFKYNRPTFSGNLSDAILYEVHLKDLSYPLKNTSSYYLEAINYASYFKDLGITHVQFMPVNSFEEVDEKEKDKMYNWGYNPTEYMALSGWYASEPDDAYTKINEFKILIDEYHKAGLLVNLDVVFNHVYKLTKFSYALLVPGYVGRCDEIDFLTDGSGCGNDLATENYMIRRLIVDTCIFFTTFYNVDGFRFDLMGLIDTATMNLIEKVTKQLNPQIILYGEAWNMKTGLAQELLASNVDKLNNIGYFSDTFRNLIKGNPFTLEKGLAMGAKLNKKEVINLLLNNDTKGINFIECHDNYTIYDQMVLTNPKWDKITQKDYLKLALGLMFITPGVPFIHLGMEFGRTKKMISNSYNKGMDINGVDFNKINEYQDVLEYIKKMISLRQKELKNYIYKEEDIDTSIEGVVIINIHNHKIVINTIYNNEYHTPGVYII